jgi:hypothetical protein
MTTAVRQAETVTRHRGPLALGWDVTVLEHRGGLATVRRGIGLLEVAVGDVAPAGRSTHRHHHAQPCETTASCHADGRIDVRACTAPPALVVSADATRRLPDVPGTVGSLGLGIGERVLMLSAAAFEALPPALVDVLRAPSARVLQADPVELLQQIFAETSFGCGALICRHPSSPGPRLQEPR